MTGRRYGPLAYVPITRRPQLTWPDSARVALWVNPKIEFFGLDDVMPGNQNERVPRDRAKIPNVRNWAAPAATSSPGCEPKPEQLVDWNTGSRFTFGV
jgi:hypothetical protein